MRVAVATSLGILLALAPQGVAQVEVRASVSSDTIGLNESLEYRVSVSGSGLSDVEEPDLDLPPGLTLFGRSKSSEVSIVNGAADRRTTFLWTYRPYGVGPVRVGPARVRVGGVSYEVPAIQLTVVQRRSPAPGVAGLPPLPDPLAEEEDSEDAFPPAADGGSGVEPIFVSNRLDKDEVYVGEQVLLTFAFYQSSRAMVLDQPNYSSAKTPGFWTQDLNREPEISRELIGGEPYTIQRFYYALFPLTAEKVIAPATLTLTLRSPVSFLDRGRTRTLAADTLRLTVKPLPTAGRPVEFSGAVGRYRLEARLEPAEVERDSPANLVLTVSGEGNIATVPPPRLTPVPGVKVFDPEVKTRVRPSQLSVRGEKEFRYLVIPGRSGALELGSASLAYFDPGTGEYLTAAADIGALVSRTPRGESEPAGGDAAATLAGIRGGPLTRGGTAPWRSPLYWIAAGAPLLALGLLLARRSRPRRISPPPVRHPAGSATLERDRSPASVDRVERDLLAYLEARYGAALMALPLAARERELAARGMPEETTALVGHALRALAAVRFAPPGTRDTALDAAVDALRALEDGERSARRRRRVAS